MAGMIADPWTQCLREEAGGVQASHGCIVRACHGEEKKEEGGGKEGCRERQTDLSLLSK